MHIFSKKLAARLLCFCTIPLVVACSAGDGDEGSDDNPTTPTELDIEIGATTDSSGRTSVSFISADGVSKLSVSAVSIGNFLRITSFEGGGVDYLSPSGVTLSLAEENSPNVVAVNAPSRNADPSIANQSRFTVSVETSGAENENVTFRVTSRRDANLTQGRMRLNIFYVGSIGNEATTRAAVQSALSEARSIFASAAGITLDVAEFSIDGPVTLPDPLSGDDLYLDAANSAASPAVNVFIGGDIAGSGGSGEVLGISSGIPGAPTPTVKSGVAISVFAGAGSDGIFSSEDIRILGETIAHESGHYMGLFHPVDFSGSVVFAADPLDDTAGCSFITDCVAREDLIRNLMFANPIPDGNGGFVRQNQLTEDQRAVLNRYSAVD